MDDKSDANDDLCNCDGARKELGVNAGVLVVWFIELADEHKYDAANDDHQKREKDLSIQF
ncbi:hypothetical protein THF1C08_10252 [Vibrio jasicida]|uniref:Uncharacterized protein n=1 Tax=Vibrio jasicida TaxID=766224 RepID=A0AAU9QFC0_9VIBR|nr:hypothetical protein THF1C08_10252 [Vibrio jasicida]CAH1564245.1 hypothetical protein THF1A12_10252 [Vibrio jasicida]